MRERTVARTLTQGLGHKVKLIILLSWLIMFTFVYNRKVIASVAIIHSSKYMFPCY